MPWRSWCYIVGDGVTEPRRVALDPPSLLGTLRIRRLMCDLAPEEASKVAIALIHDFGTIGIAEVTGPPQHLDAVRKGLADWMIADSEDELLAKLPQVMPFVPPPAPASPRTPGARAWKEAEQWLASIMAGRPTETPLLKFEAEQLLADPLVIAAGIALDNWVALRLKTDVLPVAVDAVAHQI
jgi:hypothetical protein